MWCLPRYFHRGAPKDEQGNDHTDPIPTSSTAYSGRSMSTATSSTVPSGSDHTGSISVSDMSAESMQRSQQYPSFSDRPANLRVFTFSELRNATRNLNRSLLVGEGGFGCVYRGTLKIAASPEEEAATVEVAVKHLNRNGLQGHKEWLTEVNVLGIVDHPNLVKLIGYCAQDDERGAQRLLVYEYMPNRSVDDHLSGRAIGTTLSWPMRLKVALDAARGLKYLHEDMDFQIIFRDLKTSNILLDENWNAPLPTYPSPPPHYSHKSRAPRKSLPASREPTPEEGCVPMEFLQGQSVETTVAVAVAVVAVAAGAGFILLRSKKPKGCLDAENFKEFKLVQKNQISHNVAKFKFALPTPTSVLGLPIGQHISCRGQDATGEEVIKPYTPTTLDSDIGYFELVIKMYPQGRMSHHFREMKVGDYMSVKGPKGRFKYQPGQVRAFGMIAGGSGITPMFQVTRAILENPNDSTKVHLIYANVTYDDILLQEELDTLAKNYPDRFKIYYVLNQPPTVWDGGVGFVSKDMIQSHCPAPAADIQILRCGPPPMNKAMAAHLDDIGYTKEMQFQF